MENQKKANGAHILALPYPSQGHINPMCQFCKRLVSKGTKATLAITSYISKSTSLKPDTVLIDTFSDGYDEGGFADAGDIDEYLARMKKEGSKTVAELIRKYQETNHPIDCIVYDSFLPWALDVAKNFGILGACFFTQACAVDCVYYYVHHELLKLPVSTLPVEIPGLPPLDLSDMPSYISVHGSYPAYFQMVLNQFPNVEKADFMFINTYYKLEETVIDEMTKMRPMLTVGPTIPSFYLDKRVENDNNYEINLFQYDSTNCINWLNNKPAGSVVYVAFGSMVSLPEKQVEELAMGLKNSNFHFLWVIKASEQENLLQKFMQDTSDDKGLFITWCPQLKVLSNKALGCFFSHVGWNSTIEALSLGVPMVVMPQWTDQTMNAKLVEDVWKMGLRVKTDANGIVGREEIEGCLKEVMVGERGNEMKKFSSKWRDLAMEAVCEGGTSDTNINDFISKLNKKS
ncbi:UDP-glycosyltransferase 74F2-like [Olea europaea subsp. europaea]|uniref:anthocyanidin 3-O-glucoside 5-O-glucosyltransferase n=1 Tax=Olea europaea subsp. europaea TaxID=158383 RepID=A0A8S0UDV5_OLEEU|nr:UDP-glycosyltransferase 74F2-like [Olea europaea subsp. europaea]